VSYASLEPVKPTPPPRGLACPACGGVRLDVERTQRHPGRVVRVRACLDCGRRFRTAERVESVRS
jgi:transcriptional regulator NrdR family protein